MLRDKDLIIQLVKTSFKLRYKNSFLGIVWVLIKPLLNFLILYVVWTNLLSVSQEFYSVKLMLGIVLWTFFNEGIIFGMNGLLEKAGILLKINFPRYTAIVASTLMAVINLLINLALFYVIFAINNWFKYKNLLIPSNNLDLFSLFTNILGVLFVSIIFYIIILTISFVLSILLVKLRDLQHIVELFLSLFYWFTPIVISIDYVATRSESIKQSIYYNILVNNPIGILVEQARSIIITGKFTDFNILIIIMIISSCTLGLSYLYYSRNVPNIAEYF